MKKAVITVLLAGIFCLGMAMTVNAACNHPKMLPKGAHVDTVMNMSNLTATVTVVGAEVVYFEHYNHEMGPAKIKPNVDGSFTYDMTKGLGYNFRFKNADEACSDPYVFIGRDHINEYKVAFGKLPWFIGPGTYYDCNRPGHTCCFVPARPK